RQLLPRSTLFPYTTLFRSGLGMGTPIDFSGVMTAPWVGLPKFSAPVFELHAMSVIVPVAIILVAENLGHIKAVSAMTGRNLDARSEEHTSELQSRENLVCR